MRPVSRYYPLFFFISWKIHNIEGKYFLPAIQISLQRFYLSSRDYTAAVETHGRKSCLEAKSILKQQDRRGAVSGREISGNGEGQHHQRTRF